MCVFIILVTRTYIHDKFFVYVKVLQRNIIIFFLNFYPCFYNGSFILRFNYKILINILYNEGTLAHMYVCTNMKFLWNTTYVIFGIIINFILMTSNIKSKLFFNERKANRRQYNDTTLYN